MHMFSREARIELEDGMLWYIVEGTYKNCSMDVIKINERGESWTRNIQHFGWHGWRMGVPGEKEPVRERYGYPCGGGFKWETEPWQKLPNKWVGLGMGNTQASESDLSTILKKYPKFEWLLAKTEIRSRSFLFRMLSNWSKNALATESLIEVGCANIAMDMRMPRLREPKAVMDFVRKNPNSGLNEFFGTRKYGCSIQDYEGWRRYVAGSRWGIRLTFREYMYCKENDVSFSEYKDYRGMAQKAGHDVNDLYWRFPKDIRKAHDKVQRQCAAIERAKILAENKKIDAGIRKATEKMFKNVLKTGDIKVYIPRNMDAIRKQAEILNQCLVTAEYYKRIIDRSTVLVFIAKEGEPYATAELVRHGRKYKLGQFYGDENDRNDCLAKDDAKSAFDQWAKKFKVRMAE